MAIWCKRKKTYAKKHLKCLKFLKNVSLEDTTIITLIIIIRSWTETIPGRDSRNESMTSPKFFSHNFAFHQITQKWYSDKNKQQIKLCRTHCTYACVEMYMYVCAFVCTMGKCRYLYVCSSVHTSVRSFVHCSCVRTTCVHLYESCVSSALTLVYAFVGIFVYAFVLWLYMCALLFVFLCTCVRLNV